MLELGALALAPGTGETDNWLDRWLAAFNARSNHGTIVGAFQPVAPPLPRSPGMV